MSETNLILPSGLTWEGLDRYIAGECTPEEHSSAERALATSAQLRTFVDALKGAARTPTGIGQLIESGVWSRIDGVASGSEQRTGERTRPERDGVIRGSSGRGLLRRWGGSWRAAYGTMTAVVIVFGVNYIAKLREAGGVSSSYKEYVTKPGQRASITLADGSKVMLNADTKIRLAPGFGKSLREVSVEGEALFDIVPNSAVPFTVQTNKVLTRVLGTRFTVRYYASDSAVRVVVANGRVALGPVLLNAGDEGNAVSNDRIHTRTLPDINSAFAWTTGKLVFDLTPLRSAIPELNRWYGLDIVVADTTLLSDLITMELRDESAEYVTQLLERVLKVRVEKSGAKVVLSRR